MQRVAGGGFQPCGPYTSPRRTSRIPKRHRSAHPAQLSFAAIDMESVALRGETPLKLEAKEHPSDGQRIAIIEAEHELAVLEIIFDCLDLSDIGRTRVDDALRIINRALQIERRKVGMYANGN